MSPAIGVSINLKDVFFVSYMSFESRSHKLHEILDACAFIVFTANLFIHPRSFFVLLQSISVLSYLFE
jgi:hypothetical protein